MTYTEHIVNILYKKTLEKMRILCYNTEYHMIEYDQTVLADALSKE